MFKIRKAKKEDMAKLVKVEMSSGYHKRKFEFEPYLQDLLKKNTEIFCAEEKNRIVAYITLSENGEICFLAVSKKSQCKGIANLLIKRVIFSAKKKKMKKIFLEVRNDNFSAIRLYLKNSFIVIASKKKKIEGGKIIKLRMEKEI